MKRLSLYLVAALALMIGGATLWSWFHPPKDQTLYRAVPVPYVAERSPALTKVKTVDRLVPVKVFVPTPVQAQKLGLKEPSGNLLAVVNLEPAPYGGVATVTVPDATPDNPFPKAVVAVDPKEAPFVEWLGTREASVWVGYDHDLKRTWSAELEQELWRTGPVVWKAKAGAVGDSLAGTRAYGLVGAGIKF